MIYLTWFILSILCGMLASGKGKSFFGYFLLSTFLSPLIGFIAVLIAKEDLAKVEKKELDQGFLEKSLGEAKSKESPKGFLEKSLGEAKSKEAPKDRCPQCLALQTKKDSEKGHCWKCDESLEK